MYIRALPTKYHETRIIAKSSEGATFVHYIKKETQGRFLTASSAQRS